MPIYQTQQQTIKKLQQEILNFFPFFLLTFLTQDLYSFQQRKNKMNNQKLFEIAIEISNQVMNLLDQSIMLCTIQPLDLGKDQATTQTFLEEHFKKLTSIHKEINSIGKTLLSLKEEIIKEITSKPENE